MTLKLVGVVRRVELVLTLVLLVMENSWHVWTPLQ